MAIPEEVRAAKRINAEGERIIETAHDEATRITSRAQEQAAFLIGERGLTETAQAEGRRIVEDAEGVADGIRRGADGYAADILQTLEAEAAKVLASIRKGIEVLDDRRADLSEAAPEGDLERDDELDRLGLDADLADDRDEGSRAPLAR